MQPFISIYFRVNLFKKDFRETAKAQYTWGIFIKIAETFNKNSEGAKRLLQRFGFFSKAQPQGCIMESASWAIHLIQPEFAQIMHIAQLSNSMALKLGFPKKLYTRYLLKISFKSIVFHPAYVFAILFRNLSTHCKRQSKVFQQNQCFKYFDQFLT